jgi:hypothetical protein
MNDPLIFLSVFIFLGVVYKMVGLAIQQPAGSLGEKVLNSAASTTYI